jgi:exosome complex component CSL4
MEPDSMKKKLVFPGQFLVTAEEFSPGKNAFEDDQGQVAASAVGTPEFRSKEREVDVEKKGRNVCLVERGDVIYAGVAMVKSDFVILHIFKAERDGVAKVYNEPNAVLVIRNVSRDYVEKLSDFFRVGDIVKAEAVLVSKYSIEVSTEDSRYGVVKAFCSKCKEPLHLFQGQLKCLGCGRIESRKVSSDYILR